MTAGSFVIRLRRSALAWTAAGALVALALTGAWRVAVTAGVTPVDERQASAVLRALDHAERDFAATEHALRDEARLQAGRADLVQALRQRPSGAPVEPAVIVLASATRVPELESIEVYDPTPRLLAWNGYSMPMDRAPERPDFLSGVQVEIVRDGSHRTALVAWAPVRDEGEVLGAVRVMRLVEQRMPVRNEFLRDYALSDTWQRATGLAMSVRMLDPDTEPPSPGPSARILYSTAGRPLVLVEARPPSEGEVRRMALERVDALLALWVTVLLALAVLAAARSVLRAPGRPGWRTVVFAAVLVASRYALIAIDVPARWQTGKAPLSPLFDTAHLASGWGAGLVGSVGDLLVTALLAIVFSLVVAAAVFARPAPRWAGSRPLAGLARGAGFGAAGALLFGLTASMASHVLLDSTVDYFSRSGLLPPRLVVSVFVGLLVTLLASWIGAAALARLAVAADVRTGRRVPVLFAALAGCIVPFVLLSGSDSWTLVVALVLFVGIALMPAATHYDVGNRPLQGLTARGVLFGVVMLSVILYPVLDRGYEAERRARMLDAAESFAEDRDPRVLFAVQAALDDGRRELAGRTDTADLDSLMDAELRGTLLASLGTYEVTVSVLESDGSTVGRTGGRRTPSIARSLAAQDRDDLDLLRSMRREQGRAGMIVEKLTSPIEFDRFDYVGAVEVADDSGRWLLVRAAQHEHLPAGSTPFPRVLVPAGYYGSLYPDLSIAEFRDDVLVRSFGPSFGRSYLDPEVVSALRARGSLWRRESLRDLRYLTYYVVRNQEPIPRDEPGAEMRTIAVRQAAVNVFDRLYFLLRLTVSGLVVGLAVYLVGLALRWRAGLLPAPRVRFRDRVLNAFFAVGLVTVAAMGALGLRVVTGENERAIESWLRQHLQRVEDALVQEAGADELPYRVLERIDIDSLASRVGLDLNVYRGFELQATSRPQLARDRLIGLRLPAEAYRALFVDGYRFVDVDERIGEFRYTAGYRSLPDEQGVPRFVIAVPTLPEQERLEEERARTVAYMFGALLLLVLVVMATAALIANALALPVARLRTGLERVAEGRFDRIQPLETRDEMGELVGTFNAMQDQLAESRRLLALQERQLAWREMARQVAHEIKNPLTPMKLSVQHLRRAFADREAGKPFDPVFERITSTLIDQIDALARIANEFSSFARMPLQELEPVDLNEVVREAAGLMQAHSTARITLALHPDPLPIEADREALRRVFINFIKNAVEAVPEERDARITLATRPERDEETGTSWAVGTVRDNGPGIPGELAEKIFTPSFSTKTSGTGLGLAIARNTVEELRGRIGFETEVGRGSVFWVRIPLRDGDSGHGGAGLKSEDAGLS